MSTTKILLENKTKSYTCSIYLTKSIDLYIRKWVHCFPAHRSAHRDAHRDAMLLKSSRDMVRFVPDYFSM